MTCSWKQVKYVCICQNPHKRVCPHPGAPCTPTLCLTHIPADLLHVDVLLRGLKFQKGNLVGKQALGPKASCLAP